MMRFLRESLGARHPVLGEMDTMLDLMADGALCVLTRRATYQDSLRTSQDRDVCLATPLWFPRRVNGHVVPRLPAPFLRWVMTVYERPVPAG